MLSVKDVKAAFPEYKINITSHAYTHPGVHTLPKVDKLRLDEVYCSCLASGDLIIHGEGGQHEDSREHYASKEGEKRLAQKPQSILSIQSGPNG